MNKKAFAIFVILAALCGYSMYASVIGISNIKNQCSSSALRDGWTVIQVLSVNILLLVLLILVQAILNWASPLPNQNKSEINTITMLTIVFIISLLLVGITIWMMVGYKSQYCDVNGKAKKSIYIIFGCSLGLMILSGIFINISKRKEKIQRAISKQTKSDEARESASNAELKKLEAEEAASLANAKAIELKRAEILRCNSMTDSKEKEDCMKEIDKTKPRDGGRPNNRLGF